VFAAADKIRARHGQSSCNGFHNGFHCGSCSASKSARETGFLSRGKCRRFGGNLILGNDLAQQLAYLPRSWYGVDTTRRYASYSPSLISLLSRLEDGK
jgi:hypothetical protein